MVGHDDELRKWLERQAEVLFNAYSSTNFLPTVSGMRRPQWKDQSPDERNRWFAVVNAAMALKGATR